MCRGKLAFIHMKELIESLTIRGFRGFSELTIPAFGKVNLITGKNNAGKSSVLEAIRILVSKGSQEALRSILLYREEISNFSRSGPGFDSVIEGADFDLVRSLFLNFPDVLSQGHPAEFSVKTTGRISDQFSEINIKSTWITRRKNDDESIISPYVEMPDERFGEEGGMPGLSLQIGDQIYHAPLTSILRPRIYPSRNPLTDSTNAYIYLDPFSSKSTGQLGKLWDEIALTDAQETVLSALQIVSPDIMAVSMIGGDDRSISGRTAIVRSKKFSNPVPLRSYGDGLNRLFGIILSLCNAENRILLIDEIENGLHYSVQPLVWKTIFQLAQDLNVQVFATTHSHDCIRAFQQAAADSPSEGQLTRLTQKDDFVIPTLFSEDELQIIVDNDIEVR